MTDTTDIAALMRDMRDLADRIVECQGENSDGEEIIHLYDQSDTTFKAQNILLVLNAFEAERQRADDAHKYGSERDAENESLMLTLGRLRVELAALKADQVPVAYFAAAPDYGWDIFKNKEDAIAKCQAEIDAYRDCRDDGWDDDVQRVCWGVVLQKAEGFDQQGVHTSNSHHTYQTCDYSLQPELFTAPQKPVVDYFSSLVERGKIAAEKAMSKHPQPNYVLLKVAEEAGEVVQAGVHYAEGRMTWEDLEGEVIQLIAMLNRLMVEGDQVNGVRPPQTIEAAGGIVKDGE